MSNNYQNRQFDKFKEDNTPDLSQFVFGSVQPQALDIEEAVLGAVLVEPYSFQVVNSMLVPASFYTESHQNIFKAMQELYKDSKAIDLLTVTEQLRKMGTVESIGGSYYLVELCNRVGSAANIEYHARILIQHEIKRAQILSATQDIRDAYNEGIDAFDMLEAATKRQSAVEAIPLRIDITEDLGTIAAHFLKNLEKTQNGEIIGITSGLQDFDKLTGGFQRKDLVIVAARPSMGKSMFMCNLVLNAALSGFRTAIFSLEMDKVTLFKRMVTAYSGIENDKIKGKVEFTDKDYQVMHTAVHAISALSIEIDDTPSLAISQLRAKCWKLNNQAKAKNQLLDIIFVDYLQLMRGDAQNKNGNREQEISFISRSLKALAKELDVPIIALSQLSRAVETRGGNKEPTLADLRESGAIEQDADVVHFIYRPEYYQIMEDGDGNSTKGLMKILTKKNRDGALGDTNLRADMATQKLSNWLSYDSQFPAPSVTPQDNIIKGIRGSFGEGNDTNESESALPKPIDENTLPF